MDSASIQGGEEDFSSPPFFFACPDVRLTRRRQGAPHIWTALRLTLSQQKRLAVWDIVSGQGKIIPSPQEAEHELVIVYRRHGHEDVE
ncbi:hypothetical protein [Desulfovibrio sp.]|uniref:hypothetical protein n=1 Tax=Desulfovibrio TaxID=872 RepID=UPI0025BF1B4C|nr:hypothetical protein [Desulfovibrio sp.]